ncbi:hypothetical protein BJ165DRAFT_1525014 [Panaeolus papilionaceus]|nr:hypothetical protein BJ165DRAFT_1525014 [Panaeolus papilionaceus]
MPTELAILQKGYTKLDATVKKRRNILSTRLQKGERLSEEDTQISVINSLLNPEGEGVEVGVTVQEIYDDVMAAVAAREKAGADGSDDLGLEDTQEPEPLPSVKEVLNAVSIIKRFTIVQDDELSRKTEASLDKLAWQLRLHRDQDMKLTKLTDFFKPQAF